IGQQAYGQVAVGWPEHFGATDPHRRNVSAVDVFKIAVAAQASNDHSRVFLTDVLVGEEAIDRVDDLHEWHTGNELRVNHALENGSQQRGRDSFAADVGENDGQTLGRVDGLEEIAADFLAGQVASVHPRKRN